MADTRKKLFPLAPPGRATRKAREFGLEMCQLRAQGYTYEAIRAALVGVGIEVSNRTVQREVARGQMPARQRPAEVVPAGSRFTVNTPGRPPPDPVPPETPVVPPRADQRSGKEIAEAFMRGRVNNPLLRNRSTE